MASRQHRVQRRLGKDTSLRRRLRLYHLRSTQQQQELKELEKELENSSSNNLNKLLERQRGFDNG